MSYRRHFVGERIGTRVLTDNGSDGGWEWKCDCGAAGGPERPYRLRAAACARCTPGPRLRLLTLDGRTQSMRAWAMEAGLSRQAVHQRLMDGWDLREALTKKRSPGARKPWKRERGVA